MGLLDPHFSEISALNALVQLTGTSDTNTPATESAASLAIIDDWDESDRAKVNIIVGQAGVQGGSGTVSANTQRVTLATDIALPAGENHIGSIGGNTFTLAVTQTTNASAYEAGDAVGGKITITNAMRTSGGTGILQSIHLIDKANQKAAMELLIFESDPSAATITDDTAFTYSTDISKQIARIPIATADYVTINSIATVNLGGLSKVLKASGSANLYAALITTGTPTYVTTSDIIISFGILQD